MTYDGDAPAPGSDAAIEQGCACPVLDNSHGDGWMGTDQYWVVPDCPLHGGEIPDGGDDA